MFSGGLLFTKAGESFHFVPLSESKQFKPLWGVSRTVREQTTVTEGPGVHLYIYKRTTRWEYSLSAFPFGDEGKTQLPTQLMSEAELGVARPAIVAELNRRSGQEDWGDSLNQLLNQGRETSTYLLVQNGVILLTWLSLVGAVAAFLAMFVAPSFQRIP
jgi:hypothetical protein